MVALRHVFLDPIEFDGGWLYVIVGAPTGVVYQQQYGGTACRQGKLEGFLVPVVGADALNDLRRLFEVDFRGAGTWNYRWPAEELDRLRSVVGDIGYWASDGLTDEPHALRLDDSRIPDVDEAWIPVDTPDGPGVLVWNNSD